MRLKCVGGPRDGQYWEMPAHYKDIFIPAPRTLLADPSVFDRETIENTASAIEATRYTRRILASVNNVGERDEMQFLAPDGMSDMDALRLQFSK